MLEDFARVKGDLTFEPTRIRVSTTEKSFFTILFSFTKLMKNG